MKQNSNFLKITAALFLLIGSIETSLAQKDSAQIQGRILDFYTKRPLGGVTVTYRDQDQSTFTTISDVNGYYGFTNLKTGTYTLKYTLSKYTKLQVDSITILPYESIYKDVMLKRKKHQTNSSNKELNFQYDNTIISFSSKQLLIFR